MTKNHLARAGSAFALIVGALIGSDVGARTRYLLDFDGTQIINGRTPWILRSVTKLRNSLQPDPEKLGLPERIEITEDEYRRYAGRFAKGEGELGDIVHELKLERDMYLHRPDSFLPGLYMIDEAITFENFHPATGRRGRLLEQFTKSERRVKEGLIPTFEGPAMPLLKKALSDPDTVRDVVTATARHPAEFEYPQFLRALKERGYIAHAHDPEGRYPRLISLGAPGAIIFGREGLGTRKSNAVRAEAQDQLLTMHAPHLELASDPGLAAQGVLRPVDTLIVAENEPAYIESLRRTLEALSAEYRFQAKMKFVLLNAGEPEHVADARWPWTWTVFHQGFGRPATEGEVRFWTTPGCATYLK